jgi:CheY-like chemotaxis protein
MQRSLQASAGFDSVPSLGSRTILVVEDEDLVRDMIVVALLDADYAVLEATTGEQALALLEERPVSLLFTDIRLPGGMDGWRIAEEARLLHPALPVIYATGFSGEDPRLVPNSIFLRKPYLPSTVIGTIEKLIGKAD